MLKQVQNDEMWSSLAKIGTLGAGQSLFLHLSSRERSELSNTLFLGSSKPSALSGSSFLSAERFLERDAETSSDTKSRVSSVGSRVS